ncbi:MAG: hypothetical protein K2X08_03160, partial [Chlamydiales bacterium]|nr:hypothetical protein [Chlamydiales bacterium]
EERIEELCRQYHAAPPQKNSLGSSVYPALATLQLRRQSSGKKIRRRIFLSDKKSTLCKRRLNCENSLYAHREYSPEGSLCA